MTARTSVRLISRVPDNEIMAPTPTPSLARPGPVVLYAVALNNYFQSARLHFYGTDRIVAEELHLDRKR